jgi:16S rRNA (uracil1498-N3)-methyltransferase
MHRFFIPPDWIEDDRVSLEGSLVHQLGRVLRMQPDDRIVVLDDSGWEMEVALVHVGPDRVLGHVVEKRLAQGEPRTKISLYQSVLKGQRFEFVLQKCTELGVVEFIPVIASRCIASGLDDVSRKAERWQRIILEAAEQSGRGRLPRLRAALMLARACGRAKRLGGLSLIPWEEEKQTSLRQALYRDEDDGPRGARPFSINLFIGPEGGFAAEEIEAARGYGLIPVSLGPRVLRAETAGLAAVSAIFCEFGDMECPSPP